MERGPLALFGAIVAVGVGPALWLGAQLGVADLGPGQRPAPVDEQFPGVDMDFGGAGAGDLPDDDEPFTTYSYTPLAPTVSLSAVPRPRQSTSATAILQPVPPSPPATSPSPSLPLPPVSSASVEPSASDPVPSPSESCSPSGPSGPGPSANTDPEPNVLPEFAPAQ
ncbi:hypothetical protein [Actinoplanes derwentensis]|uniref:Uncharacterized protein n=1 Tax=Actinoplanes derwentensis TaxID=113562 RepID=A0A1H2CEC1_9ACTN|nr:hypothetical protein [Actinoplanes derwentensis]GID86041.1 hypothetical protein Ade03nite_49650 [Actinoplanes derwentensis]SDT68840.1 hypothetical protein SAMN04489716_5683 [Actinoplanes derwentensis]